MHNANAHLGNLKSRRRSTELDSNLLRQVQANANFRTRMPGFRSRNLSKTHTPLTDTQFATPRCRTCLEQSAVDWWIKTRTKTSFFGDHEWCKQGSVKRLLARDAPRTTQDTPPVSTIRNARCASAQPDSLISSDDGAFFAISHDED